MKTLRILVLVAGLLLAVGIVQGQDDACPVVVQTALDVAGDNCGETGRNEICYGNVLLEADPQDGITVLTLDNPGDIEDVASVRRVQLSSMDTAASEWGIALMRLQANLPDALPGQNVLFVLFGDVEMESAVPSNAEPLTEMVTATGGVNLRQGPSTNTAVVGGLAAGDDVTVDGISEDGLWLRVRLDEGHAWVFADLVTTDGDLDMLDTVQATDAPLWRPMQAFYLQTGLRDSACTEAPASGVLVQTPAGAETVTFRVNEVDIALGSTAYLQAGDELRVAVVEGQAEVTAFDVTRTVPAGAQVFVPLDANGVASGPPGLPEAYAIEGMAALPVTLLDEAVVVAEPLSDRELTRYTNCLVRASTNVNLRTGPGDSYYLEREMPPGTMLADAQAQDVDGTVWWRLSTDVWLNSDDVQEIGGCDVLPMVEPPSPSIDEIVTHFSEIIMVDFSEACEARYPIGTTIRVGWGDDGRWLDRSANAQEAAAYFSALGHFITINGVGVPISERVFWGSNPYGPGWNYYSYYDWTPTETGVYRVIGDDPSPAPPVGCTVTIY